MIKQQLSLDGASYSIWLPDAETDYIQGKIAKDKQPYELEMLRDMASRLQPEDLVLDVGANIGNHTLYLASVAACRVHAFEPNGHLCEALAQSIAHNSQGDRVTIHQVGVAAAKGIARFAHLDTANLGAQSLEKILSDDEAGVELVALDEMEWSAAIRMIKIDVEGMEIDVLKGAQQLIRRDKPILYIESQTAEDFELVCNQLGALGYLYCTTFNATPTHVFQHESTLSISNDMPGLLAEKARQLYAFKAETAGLRGKLQECNFKYRDTNERIKQLAEQRDQAASKYREASSQIALLKLNIEKQQLRLKELEFEGHKLGSELKLAQDEKAAVQRALSAMRTSQTYQAGMYVRAASGSIKEALKLPVRLWRLRKQAVGQESSMAVGVTRATNNQPVLRPATEIDRKALHTAGFAQRPSRQLRMACVMDDFTYGSYAPECELLQLTPQNWHNELENFQPEVLFIESAWRGKDELWGSKVGHCSQELQGIVAWCRQRHIPTLFWNKEDPVHFETFLTTAQLFDFVFTTDMDCIHRYKAALGHEHVYFLPFACQPAVHNPIEKYVRKDAFCFAGAYYVRYPERTRDLESFVKELPAHRPLEIYDRNYGKDDPNYQFPAEYQPHIVGTLPFTEIDKAYKGYRYAINLNSIKQSQTMFARRVYELLGSNTLTISNYSRGVRLMFGDLVVTSDSGNEIRRRLEQLEADSRVDRLRLAGLRKVMSEHTYADRLNYILEKITGQPRARQLPAFTVIAMANDQLEAQAIITNAQRQQGVELELLLVCGNLLKVEAAQTLLESNSLKGRTLSEESLSKQHLQELAGEQRWICGMHPTDYYGAHYLLDMALATRYSAAQVIGKAAYYCADEQGAAVLHDAERAYHAGQQLAARRSVIHPALAQTLSAREWLQALADLKYSAADQLAIDSFNYCEGAGSNAASGITAQIDDVAVNQGISLANLGAMAEGIAPMQSDLEHAPWLDGAQFAHALLGEPFTWLNGHGLAASKDEGRSVRLTRNEAISARLVGPLLEIDSQLPDGKHEYLYAAKDLPLLSLQEQPSAATNRRIPLHLQIDPGLNLSLVVLYLDAGKQRLGHEVLQANRNTHFTPLDGTHYVRLGLRVYAGGSCKIHRLVLGHLDLEPANILGQSDVLLLTNHYPSYDDLYRNGFVHSRVKAYREYGVSVDIFRLRKDQPINWHEFQDIDVTTGSQQALRRMLASGRYRHILVHFLDPDMWEVLKDFIDNIKVTVWVHGAEVQPWWRREYNYQNEADLEKAKIESDKRLEFWRGLFKDLPVNLRYVFVSRYFADEVVADVGIRLPESHYRIIHNPVDTDIFSYSEKLAEQRKKILSIRPYASRKYANDLSVQAVLELSKESYFSELEFKFVGDGALFDEVLEPLKVFNNVIIERGFLSQPDIASLHKGYGVFLCPTRMDAQGVSKDEAMSSGLVVISNAVTAIPEFVDDQCGILADAEDHVGMAEGIKALYFNPDKFAAMSISAAERARKQVGKKHIVCEELALIAGVGHGL